MKTKHRSTGCETSKTECNQVSISFLHPLLGLEVGGVEVRVQQDDGKRQDEDGVR
jgi:hypothetical protein